MCAMSPRLLRPIASGVHPEAADWRARVIANGGTVSGSTLQAVSRLCTSISSAGIRDRFYRLGIFAGDNLNAALVPLYRGPTFGGTTYGNATDTNNAFVGVGTDYAETGASGGLTGNGSSKYLNTGLAMNFTGLRDYHMSAHVFSVSGNANLLGADTLGDGVSPRAYQALATFTSTPRIWVWYNIGTTFLQPQSSSDSYAPGFLAGVGSSAANNLYSGGSSVGSAGAATNETISRSFPIYVFAANNRNSAAASIANARLGMYSIGLSMTAVQVAALNSAVAAFNGALSRT